MRSLILSVIFVWLAMSSAWGQHGCSFIQEDRLTCDNGTCHSYQYHSVCTGSGPYGCVEPCGYGLCCDLPLANACYQEYCYGSAQVRRATFAPEIARLYVPDVCRGHFSVIEDGELLRRPPSKSATQSAAAPAN